MIVCILSRKSKTSGFSASRRKHLYQETTGRKVMHFGFIVSLPVLLSSSLPSSLSSDVFSNSCVKPSCFHGQTLNQKNDRSFCVESESLHTRLLRDANEQYQGFRFLDGPRRRGGLACISSKLVTQEEQ